MPTDNQTTTLRTVVNLIGRLLSGVCAAQYLWWLTHMVGSWFEWTDWPQPGQSWVALAFGAAFLASVEAAFPSLRKAIW